MNAFAAEKRKERKETKKAYKEKKRRLIIMNQEARVDRVHERERISPGPRVQPFPLPKPNRNEGIKPHAIPFKFPPVKNDM